MWDPVQYAAFEEERSLPFRDLVARLEMESPQRILDLGCGSGALTATLLNLYPSAQILGIDSSPEMLADAFPRSVPGRLRFEEGDCSTFEPQEPYDIIVSNAVFQWLDAPLPVVTRLAGSLTKGGVLALQIPVNHSSLAHQLLRRMAGSPQWMSLLSTPLPGRNLPPPVSKWRQAIVDGGARPLLMTTTYHHRLAGPQAVVEWMKGTALRPVLSRLSEAEGKSFLSDFESEIARLYPLDDDGVDFPFPRLFVYGRQ